MKKHSLLNLLKQVKDDAELKEIDQGIMMQVMVLLIDYINDPDIREAIDDIPM